MAYRRADARNHGSANAVIRLDKVNRFTALANTYCLSRSAFSAPGLFAMSTPR